MSDVAPTFEFQSCPHANLFEQISMGYCKYCYEERGEEPPQGDRPLVAISTSGVEVARWVTNETYMKLEKENASLREEVQRLREAYEPEYLG